ncbi:MAG TPA: hypothetical protein VIL55_09650 [Naasia sp.]|jgi:hypothetical protein
MSGDGDDRIPEANSPDFQGDEWDADATDTTGALDEVGETLRSELPDPVEGGEDPRHNEDRLSDRS